MRRYQPATAYFDRIIYNLKICIDIYNVVLQIQIDFYVTAWKKIGRKKIDYFF